MAIETGRRVAGVLGWMTVVVVASMSLPSAVVGQETTPPALSAAALGEELSSVRARLRAESGAAMESGDQAAIQKVCLTFRDRVAVIRGRILHYLDRHPEADDLGLARRHLLTADVERVQFSCWGEDVEGAVLAHADARRDFPAGDTDQATLVSMARLLRGHRDARARPFYDDLVRQAPGFAGPVIGGQPTRIDLHDGSARLVIFWDSG